MTEPWQPEQLVSAELAASLIDEQFPTLAPATVEPLAVGWDNTAFTVNAEYVFRFPRRQIAAGLLDIEHRLLPVIAPRLPLPVPEPSMLGWPGDTYPWPFAGHRMLPGTTACVANLTADQRARAAEPLGRFLRALHASDLDQARAMGVPGDLLGRLDLDKRMKQTRDNFDKMLAAELIDDAGPWQAIVDQVDRARPQAIEAVLVHGDLYARHVLVGNDGSPCGIIDWGDVHIGDPATDLSIAHGLLPPQCLPDFRRAYGPIDDERWMLARFRALQHACVTVPYGYQVGDEALVREGLTVLEQVLG